MLRTITLYVGCLIPLVAISSCGSASMSSLSQQSPNISISPTSAAVGSVDVALTVTGSAFSNDSHKKSIVVFSAGSDTALSTTFISSSQLSAIVPANLMVNPVTADIFVETGDPSGSGPFAKSDKVAFSVVARAPGLTISAVSPAGALAGSPDLTITITGTGFVNSTGPHNSTWVEFIFSNSENSLATTFVSSTQLTAVIPAALMASPVSGKIEVKHGDRAASFPPSTSNAIPFNVTPQ